jgi:hypothetical protein
MSCLCPHNEAAFLWNTDLRIRRRTCYQLSHATSLAKSIIIEQSFKTIQVIIVFKIIFSTFFQFSLKFTLCLRIKKFKYICLTELLFVFCLYGSSNSNGPKANPTSGKIETILLTSPIYDCNQFLKSKYPKINLSKSLEPVLLLLTFLFIVVVSLSKVIHISNFQGQINDFLMCTSIQMPHNICA